MVRLGETWRDLAGLRRAGYSIFDFLRQVKPHPVIIFIISDNNAVKNNLIQPPRSRLPKDHHFSSGNKLIRPPLSRAPTNRHDSLPPPRPMDSFAAMFPPRPLASRKASIFLCLPLICFDLSVHLRSGFLAQNSGFPGIAPCEGRSPGLNAKKEVLKAVALKDSAGAAGPPGAALKLEFSISIKVIVRYSTRKSKSFVSSLISNFVFLKVDDGIPFAQGTFPVNFTLPAWVVHDYDPPRIFTLQNLPADPSAQS